VTVAVLRKLVASGKLDPDAETVVFNTGEGLKTLDAVAQLVGPTHRVRPSLRALRDAGLLG
jgi:threonine synthase